jgi:hypothetical protein
MAERQTLPDSADTGLLLGFTPAWYALGVVGSAFLENDDGIANSG